MEKSILVIVPSQHVKPARELVAKFDPIGAANTFVVSLSETNKNRTEPTHGWACWQQLDQASIDVLVAGAPKIAGMEIYDISYISKEQILEKEGYSITPPKVRVEKTESAKGGAEPNPVIYKPS